MNTLLSSLSPDHAARTAAIRLLILWIPLSLLIGLAFWIYETERLEDKVLANAVHDARQVTPDDLAQFYAGTRALADLHASARKVLGDFVSVEIYDRTGEELVLESSKRANLIHQEVWRRAERAQLGSAPVYDQFRLHGQMIIITTVPIRRAASEEILGYVKGIYLTPAATMQEMREDSFGAILIAVGSVLVTLLLVFPIILFMQREHANQNRRVLEGNMSLLEVLGNAIAHRDSDTDSHNYRVTIYALRLAQRMALDDARMRTLTIGAFLHDVGKIGISDNILLKPGKLTEAEFAIMQTHVAIGAEIVERSPWLSQALSVVEHHHEKFDGSGYPHGIAGAAIPLEARIFAVADVFDALTTQRPYKKAMSMEEALAIMQQGSGRHFDPQVLAIFTEISGQLFQEISQAGHEQLRLLMQEAVRRHLVD